MLQTLIKSPLIKPRSVYCIIERAYRSPEVAEAVSAGRFSHAGITLEMGLEPDWLTAEFPEDEEWRIEWSKFYYGLDLAYAFRQTGERKYLRAWERLVLSWIRQVPVDFDSSDVTGRRIQNWIYAWDSFAKSIYFDGFTEGFEEKLLTSLSEQVGHLRSHLTAERNHRTLELYALFVAALALPELDQSGSLTYFAATELHRNLLTDIRPDGVHRENSTHYHMLVLRSFVGACVNALRFGLELPEGFYERVERACEFAMHCHRPDGLIPALSDSDTGSYPDVLELAAELFGRPDFLYVGTRGKQGVPPAQTNASFPDGGYFIQRSDWGGGVSAYSNARFLIFDCGPLGDGGHGHYDLLSVEIAGGGRPLIVDPGRFTYSEHGPLNWRRWFKSTAAHNTVCVDGQDQTPYRPGKPKGPTARGTLMERLSAPGFDLLCGEAISPAYEAKHTRRIFFVGGEYWLIVDELRGTQPHNYDLRFHLTPEAWNKTSIEHNGVNHVVRAPGLVLVFDHMQLPCIESGWFAPAYGVKLPSPVVSVIMEGVAETYFFTLVVPAASNSPAPALRAQAEQSGNSLSIVAGVQGVGADHLALDRLVWSNGVRPFEFGMFKGQASAAWHRVSATKESLAFTACNVRDLKQASGESESHIRSAPWAAWDKHRGLTRAKEVLL